MSLFALSRNTCKKGLPGHRKSSTKKLPEEGLIYGIVLMNDSFRSPNENADINDDKKIGYYLKNAYLLGSLPFSVDS